MKYIFHTVRKCEKKNTHTQREEKQSKKHELREVSEY